MLKIATLLLTIITLANTFGEETPCESCLRILPSLKTDTSDCERACSKWLGFGNCPILCDILQRAVGSGHPHPCHQIKVCEDNKWKDSIKDGDTSEAFKDYYDQQLALLEGKMKLELDQIRSTLKEILNENKALVGKVEELSNSRSDSDVNTHLNDLRQRIEDELKKNKEEKITIPTKDNSSNKLEHDENLIGYTVVDNLSATILSMFIWSIVYYFLSSVDIPNSSSWHWYFSKFTRSSLLLILSFMALPSYRLFALPILAIIPNAKNIDAIISSTDFNYIPNSLIALYGCELVNLAVEIYQNFRMFNSSSQHVSKVFDSITNFIAIVLILTAYNTSYPFVAVILISIELKQLFMIVYIFLYNNNILLNDLRFSEDGIEGMLQFYAFLTLFIESLRLITFDSVYTGWCIFFLQLVYAIKAIVLFLVTIGDEGNLYSIKKNK